MPQLLFDRRFAGAVERGEKRQTIRPERKRPIRPGDKLILSAWEGVAYRSKVRRLGEDFCKSAEEIKLNIDVIDFQFVPRVLIAGKLISYRKSSELAKADGFENLNEMLDWFNATYGLPFKGVLIKW